MGLFGFLGGLLGGGAQKKASRAAETAQLGFLNRALDIQQNQYNQDRADYAPFREGGTEAFGSILDLIGQNGPEAQARAMALVESNPSYQRTIVNGTEGVLQNAAATGGVRGGNVQDALSDNRADWLAQAIDAQLGRLGNVAGLGFGATQAGSASGANLTGQIANNLSSQGQVRAGGLLTRGGITAGMWNNAGNFADSSLKTILGLF